MRYGARLQGEKTFKVEIEFLDFRILKGRSVKRNVGSFIRISASKERRKLLNFK